MAVGFDSHFPYEAVVFDLDGVLIDSEPIHFDVTSRFLAEDGVRLEPEVYRLYVGRSLEATWEGLVSQLGLPRSAEEYETLYLDAITEALNRPLESASGAVALIDALKRQGVRLALASSSKRVWVEASLRGIGLTRAFESVITGDDVANAKPNPEIYLLAARRLGVESTRCLAIEDAPAGVQSAHAAGMDVVAVRTPLNEGEPFSDAIGVVTSLDEVLPGVAGK